MSDHDNDTCPHLVRASLLEAENARLKTEVERLRASSFVTAVPVEQYERVIKAGDDMAEQIEREGKSRGVTYVTNILAWRSAKEGKPSV